MSDDLLGRADSLMRRSRTFVAGRTATGPADDGIPLLTEEVDLEALITAPEPEDHTEEITAAVTARVTGEVTERVTAEVTEQVTAEVTERVTADVTARVTAEVAERVSKEVTQRVTEEVTERVGNEAAARAREEMQRAAADALTVQFGDLAGLVQSLIDDWCSTTLPALIGTEIQSAFENATARIRERAILDLRDSMADEIEARSRAVVGAVLAGNLPAAPEQPL
ncbi:MAG TPA: hypothetical protein VIO81_16720 [Methyloversatilis sp.]